MNSSGSINGGSCEATPPSSAASLTQTPTKGKQQIIAGTAFVYPQIPLQHLPSTGRVTGSGSGGVGVGGSGNCGYFANTNTIEANNPTSGGGAGHLFVDLNARSVFSDGGSITGGYDTGGISDDDRMSLENSVFEESLNSTPVKLPSHNSTAGKLFNGTLAAKTLAALTGDVCTALKRSNRSSSSTVDSSITSSSGYGSSTHSERLASTSTTADFRSRFSSVDTQSSLDSCLTEKTSADSPLTKETFKMERSLNLNDVMLNLNNNEMTAAAAFVQANNLAANNNNIQQMTSNKLPIVPVRATSKSVSPSSIHQQQHGNQQKLGNQSQSQHSLNNSIDSSNKGGSTVPNSTSTSSTASAGSSISTGSSMSISASGSGNSPLAPPTPQQQQQQQHQPTTTTTTTQHQKRPPMPPARVQNFEMHDSSQKGFTSMGQQQQQQPPINIRNQLNRSKRPPPIQYPKLHQRQDSNLSSDSFSVTSSPGYNSKNLMDAPLLQNAARINKSGGAVAAAMRHQDSNDSFGMSTSRFGSNGPIVPPRHKFNFRQDSTISSDSFSQTSSPGYNTKIMEAPLLPSLSVKRLCNGESSPNILIVESPNI